MRVADMMLGPVVLLARFRLSCSHCLVVPRSLTVSSCSMVCGYVDELAIVTADDVSGVTVVPAALGALASARPTRFVPATAVLVYTTERVAELGVPRRVMSRSTAYCP